MRLWSETDFNIHDIPKYFPRYRPFVRGIKRRSLHTKGNRPTYSSVAGDAMWRHCNHVRFKRALIAWYLAYIYESMNSRLGNLNIVRLNIKTVSSRYGIPMSMIRR